MNKSMDKIELINLTLDEIRRSTTMINTVYRCAVYCNSMDPHKHSERTIADCESVLETARIALRDVLEAVAEFQNAKDMLCSVDVALTKTPYDLIYERKDEYDESFNEQYNERMNIKETIETEVYKYAHCGFKPLGLDRNTQKKKFKKDGFVDGARFGIELAQKWFSKEEKEPEIGSVVIVKNDKCMAIYQRIVKDGKKYNQIAGYCDFTHWRYIGLPEE